MPNTLYNTLGENPMLPIELSNSINRTYSSNGFLSEIHIYVNTPSVLNMGVVSVIRASAFMCFFAIFDYDSLAGRCVGIIEISFFYTKGIIFVYRILANRLVVFLSNSFDVKYISLF